MNRLFSLFSLLFILTFSGIAQDRLFFASMIADVNRAPLKRMTHIGFPATINWLRQYLARPDLTALHVERTGLVEGFDRADILRYLRHEMGHVVNYAYRLYDQEEWVKQFGSITQPYSEEYRPEPFSRRYVRHLPGWYAQKHPDEDWSETFAVWMTPGRDWRREYSGWPVAAAKLAY